MIHDEPSRKLPLRELTTLAFRRTNELGMASTLAAGLAVVIGTLLRLPPHPEAWRVVIIPAAIVLVVLSFYALRWRRPPQKTLDRIRDYLEQERRAGRRPAALSRRFLAVAGVFTFGVALALVLAVPMR